MQAACKPARLFKRYKDRSEKMIRGIHFKNFSLLRDFQIGLSKDQLARSKDNGVVNGLGPLTALIGKNSTGKSTLFEGLAFFRDVVKYGLTHASVMKGRGGFARLKTQPYVEGRFPNEKAFAEENMVLGLLFEKTKNLYFSYELELGADEYGRPYISQENLTQIDLLGNTISHKPLIQQVRQADGKSQLFLVDRQGNSHGFLMEDAKDTALSFWGRVSDYEPLSYVYRNISKIFYYPLNRDRQEGKLPEKGGHRNLRETGNNLINVLDYMEQANGPRYKSWLADMMERVYGPRGRKRQFNLDDMSTGERKLFEMLVILENEYSLICFDEPDVSLYYKMVETLLLEMRNYGMRYKESQIMISTHDSSLLQGVKPEEIWLMERSEEDANVIARQVGLDPVVQAMHEQGIDMGTLWYGGHLGDV